MFSKSDDSLGSVPAVMARTTERRLGSTGEVRLCSSSTVPMRRDRYGHNHTRFAQ
jgi:hypothetical protein